MVEGTLPEKVFSYGADTDSVDRLDSGFASTASGSSREGIIATCNVECPCSKESDCTVVTEVESCVRGGASESEGGITMAYGRMNRSYVLVGASYGYNDYCAATSSVASVSSMGTFSIADDVEVTIKSRLNPPEVTKFPGVEAEHVRQNKMPLCGGFRFVGW